MLFHEIIRPSVGTDLSRPAPIYRPGWLFRYPEYLVNPMCKFFLLKKRFMTSYILRTTICTILRRNSTFPSSRSPVQHAVSLLSPGGICTH